MTGPALPARKAGGRRTAAPASGKASSLPILNATEIELPDGSKVPIKIPPTMPPTQAQALIAYLQANPEAAKQANDQAQQIMKTPGLANAFLNMNANLGSGSENASQYAALKDDPDLKEVFDEVSKSGPAAFAKYWNDDALMTKISAKLRAAQGQEAVPSAKPKHEAGSLGSLFDAAKFGDIESAKKLLAEGKDVNEKNDKNVTPLGIAVGFNNVAMVQFLIEEGKADVNLGDGTASTPLHYAAGYGRKEAAELLIASGARLDATNDKGQKAIDVAKLNREKAMCDYLRQKWNEVKDAEHEARIR